MDRQLAVVVLISGSGTNLQAIIDACAHGHIPARITAVVSDKPEAFGLSRAERAGIETRILTASGFADREAYDRALGGLLDQLQADLVVLAGFMRILTAGLVHQWAGRMLNIHPSLLPDYRGLHTHQRVLDAGETFHGTSVHFVTEELDGGPVIAQARLAVRPDDTAETLNQRVQALEHRMYPRVIGWYAEGRLKMVGDSVQIDGKILEAPIVRDEAEWLRS
ncbi:MAG: phosphoribosylglycinamide formyltransferase [Gammaproteobacteria bacterium]|jgi:phosphoribosylglycinamide formyltransferase-1